jgi:serine/threonine protein kinase
MPPVQTLGPYTLDALIAVGGMAEIWLARREGPGGFSKRLVIKRILPLMAQDEKFREMFLDEARLAANFEHPNIVRVFELGEVDGSYFIAMEFVDGPDLDYIIKRARQLDVVVPATLAAKLIADALEGLDYVHGMRGEDGQSTGLVHRDISPHNVMVTSRGVAKICDFGVAKAATSRHKTQAGTVKGKFAYMSPEQIAAKPLDGRSDLFAVGIVLYELSTNQRPFGEADELLAVTAILTQKPQDPRLFVDDYPEELERIIMKALAKNRDDRYADARDMQADLHRFIRDSGEIVNARDISEYIDDLLSESPSFYTGTVPLAAPRFSADSVLSASADIDARKTEPSGPRLDSVPVEPIQSLASRRAPSPSTDEAGSGPRLLLAALGLLGLLGVVVVGVIVWIAIDGGPTRESPDAGTVVAGDAGGDTAEPDAAVVETDVADAVAHGRVIVVTQPSAEVFKDGKTLGKTVPHLTLRMPVGEHQLHLRNLAKGVLRDIKVTVKVGPPTEVNEFFEFGEVNLKLPAGDVKVTIDGVAWPSDPRKPFPLSTGAHKIGVKMTDRDLAVHRVTIVAGKTSTIKIK